MEKGNPNPNPNPNPKQGEPTEGARDPMACAEAQPDHLQAPQALHLCSPCTPCSLRSRVRVRLRLRVRLRVRFRLRVRVRVRVRRRLQPG